MDRKSLIAAGALLVTFVTPFALDPSLAAAESANADPAAEEPSADDRRHAGRSPEEWAEIAEDWARWGEEFGEQMGRWGEELGERWGEEFAQKWAEENGENWQKWAEQMAERGESWEELGERIGQTVEKALSDVDWEAIGRSVEGSMKSLEAIDWEALGADIGRQMEELDKRLGQESENGAAPE